MEAISYKFLWKQSTNNFQESSPLMDSSLKRIPCPLAIIKVVETIEKKSGVKRASFLLRLVILFILATLGNSAGFLLIYYMPAHVIGRIVMAATPFLAFIVTIGAWVVQGSQKTRVERYLCSYKKQRDAYLSSINASIVYSFYECKKTTFCIYFLAETYKFYFFGRKITLWFTHKRLEGSLEFFMNTLTMVEMLEVSISELSRQEVVKKNEGGSKRVLETPKFQSGFKDLPMKHKATKYKKILNKGQSHQKIDRKYAKTPIISISKSGKNIPTKTFKDKFHFEVPQGAILKSKTYNIRNRTKPTVHKVENSTLSNLESDLDFLQGELATPNISNKMSLYESELASVSRRGDVSIRSRKISSPNTIRKRGGTSEFNFFKKKTEKIINFDPVKISVSKPHKQDSDLDSISKLQNSIRFGKDDYGGSRIFIEDE